MSRLAYLIWPLLVAGSLWLVVHVAISTDMRAFLPRRASPAQQVLVEQMRSGAVARLLVVAIDGADAAVLAQQSRQLGEKLRADPAFAQVQNGDAAATARDRELIWTNRYLLSPAIDAAHFDVPALRASLEKSLALLAGSGGMAARSLVTSDPTGEMTRLLPLLLRGTARPASEDGIWISPDRKRALLLVETNAEATDLDAQERAISAIQRLAAPANVTVSGPGQFAVEARRQMKHDVGLLSTVAIVGITIVLLVAYRDPRLLLLSLLPVASGVLFGFAAVALGFGTVHGITLGFGVTLIGEAVDYAIYLFLQSGARKSIWPTLLLGAATSVVGFAAMLFSDFDGLAQLGLFTIVGLCTAVAVTRFILRPLNIHATARPLQLPNSGRAAPVLVGLFALASLAFLLTRPVLFDASLHSMSPVPPAVEQLDRQLRADLGTPEFRYLLVLPVDTDVETVLAGLSFDAPNNLLPSQEVQRRRQAALPESATLRARFDEARRDLPFRGDQFEPFFAAVEATRTGPLLNLASFDGSALGLRLRTMLRGDGSMLVPVYGNPDPARLRAIDNSVLVDLRQESDALLGRYLHEAIQLALIGGVGILVLLAIALRSATRVACVVAPLCAASFASAAISHALAGALSVFHLFGLLLVVAVGSNYALFLEQPTERDRLFRSLIVANLCTVIGFGVLSISSTPVLRGLGSTVAIGTALSLVFALLLARKEEA
ncbi:MMPL family transporter [Roseiterribacter gracilis]|uniref:Membrane protein n=1 Tax=Roseiterribacter gracilis TaxID=2812848 RepID=A0A8S8X9G3_9PROT|nr:membrane protein [Rhodospirillales bacterium TMPK1]